MGRWTKGKTLSVQEVRMKNGLVHGTIDCLTEGSEYMFRIKAVNKGGPSEPSDPSDSMIAKIRFSKKNAQFLIYSCILPEMFTHIDTIAMQRL